MRYPTKTRIIRKRPLRYYRTTGLMPTQMQELVWRVGEALPEPWAKKLGRPRSCGLYHAVEIACMYIRHNSPQEFLGDLSGISQPTVSRIIAKLVPIVKAVLEEFVPSAEDAIEVVKGRVCLVDGTITPCWSYGGHDELWSRKRGTTGFNAQLICLLSGNAVYISDPLPGCTHDATAYAETAVEKIVQSSGGGIGDKGYQGTGLVTPRKKPKGGELSKGDKKNNAHISALRAPVERLVAHFKGWRILHTDYRRPYGTYLDAYDAARGLFFFSIANDFE
jgi:DDE superfamily endonuclease/Helix-turn-helix of DDE superfamily endonuclease